MATKLDSLESLFFEELRDLYDAEIQMMTALPKMALVAHSEDLRRGFEDHLDQTKRQADRLEQIFNQRGIDPAGKKCVGMQGILRESEELMSQQDVAPEVMDAGLIVAAQKAEHYEIAGYGATRTYAQELGFDEAARLLQHTLDEEAKTDERLTSLAVGHINLEAKQ